MRSVFVCVLAIICVCFSACGGTNEDLSSVLAGPFEAELAGTVCGIAFEARLSTAACSASGIVPATLTFYAPQELSGTVLARDGEGKVTMSYDGIATKDVGGVGLLLLTLFPSSEEIKQAALNDVGNTVVLFERAEVEFSKSNVPLFIKTEDVEAEIISWKKQ